MSASARGSRGRFRASASGPTSTASPAELGVAGHVLNDSPTASSSRSSRPVRDRGRSALPSPASPDWRRRDRSRRRGRARDRRRAARGARRAGLLDPREPGRRGAARRGDSRQRDLRRLPGRALRSRRQALPLPVHQLHELRSPLHDRARRPLRPAEHDDVGVRDVLAVPRRVPRPGGPPLPRSAERLSGLRAAGATSPTRAGARGRGSRRAGPARGDRAGAARRGDRRAEGHRRIPPRVPGRRRGRGGRPARAQAPRGQAVRADGTRPRRRARAGRPGAAGGGPAARPGAADRARAPPPGWCASRPRSLRDPPSSA